MTELTVGAKAPLFSLLNQEGKQVSLSDFRGKWLVLYFYPKDDTPGSTIEAIDFTKYVAEFQKLGATIIGVSPDTGKSHCKFQEKHTLKVELLSDESKIMMEKYGVWGKKKFMGREYMGVMRTTFLIDSQGKIAHIWENVKVNGHVEEVLEKVKGVQKN